MKRIATLAIVSLAALAGCRGGKSDSPPIHFNPNMDTQPRYDPQAEAKFYEDRRTMRAPEEGTVPRDNFSDDDAYLYGRDGEKYVVKAPMPLTEDTLKRGQERYNIYCTPCHDKTGAGNGTVVQRGFAKPTNLQDEYARKLTDGQLYKAINEGARNMPAYGAQVPVQDRWAIVAYVRALQFASNARLEDIPADKRQGIPEEVVKQPEQAK